VILDLGAGSGILAITLAAEIRGSRVIAIEQSAEAISVIRQNWSADFQSALRADFFHCPIKSASVDLIVSNPPYVEKNTELPQETLFEPQLALITQNLEQTYSELLKEAFRMLKPHGYFVFEIGYDQADRIKKLCQPVLIRKDLQGIDRVFVVQKK
jgi:release factor glutamine methyltransferase